jgi:hypothetical protein
MSVKKINKTASEKFDTFRETVEKKVGKPEEPEENKVNKTIIDSLKNFADQARIQKLKATAFESQATLFINQKTKRKIYAKNNTETKTLVYRLNDGIAEGERLIDLSTNQLYDIKYVSRDPKIIKVEVDGEKYEIVCKEARYELSDGKKDRSEEINKLLDSLERSINDAKDGMVIKRKPETLRLFGLFKEKVQNGEKDQALFNQFLDSLTMLSPYLPAAAQKIIYLLDH